MFISVTDEQVTFELLEGSPLEIYVYEQSYSLADRLAITPRKGGSKCLKGVLFDLDGVIPTILLNSIIVLGKAWSGNRHYDRPHIQRTAKRRQPRRLTLFAFSYGGKEHFFQRKNLQN